MDEDNIKSDRAEINRMCGWPSGHPSVKHQRECIDTRRFEKVSTMLMRNNLSLFTHGPTIAEIIALLRAARDAKVSV